MVVEDFGDYTLRFYNYVCSLSDFIAGYLPLNVNKPVLSNNLVYLCLPENRYEKQRLMKKVKGIPYADLPPKFYKLQSRRLLLPNKWSVISKLYADKNIKFIVFPIICKKKGACARRDLKKHTTLLIYNKALCQFESWDDLFGVSQKDFGIHRLLRTDESIFIRVYLTSVLKEHFNFKFDNEEIAVPKFKENLFGKLKTTMEKANLNNDYTSIYAAYLIDYIKKRIKSPSKSYDELFKEIDYKKLPEYSIELMKFTNDWKVKYRCEHPMKVLNTESGKCVNVTTSTGKALLGIKKVCDFPNVINVKSKRCKKIDLNTNYINEKRKKYLHSHALWDDKYVSTIISYFMKKYPYMASDPKNSHFLWEIPEDDSTAYWELTPPDNYLETTRKGMINPDIRFIVFFIVLNQDTHDDAHSNCLIIDKVARTIERYEPNEPSPWEDFNNGKDLDDAVTDAFKEFNLEYVPMMKTCPYGFQGIEGREDSGEIVKFGGNCAIWTMWYMNLRLANPLVPRKILVTKAWKELVKEGALKLFINGYHDYLLRIAKKGIK